MAQYIQHPALMGAQQADEMSRQRMNMVGQSIMQANAAIDRAAAIDAARKAKVLEQYQLIAAGINPVTGQSGFSLPADRTPYDTAVGNILTDVESSIAARGRFDPGQIPGATKFQVGESRASAAEPTLPVGTIGNYSRTMPKSEIPMYGRPYAPGVANELQTPYSNFWESIFPR